MDEFTADAFANRDTPVPLLKVTSDDDPGFRTDSGRSGWSKGSSNSKRERIRQSLSATRISEKAQAHVEKLKPETGGKMSMQDRVFAKILQSMIPSEDVDNGTAEVVDRRSSMYVRRPAFSLPLMTNNFRKFNARIGIVFVFQNRMIRLFTWRTPTHTISFLSVYTFVCLDPYLLVVVPLAAFILFVMVPAFLARHPPPPPSASTSSTTPYYSYSGPALAPAPTIKPASETSKDFFRNMRDLQNSMADFSSAHDAMIKMVAPSTNFSDEELSSKVFLYMTVATALLFIAAHLVPWRAAFLVGGYFMVVSGHPVVQDWLSGMQKKAEAHGREFERRASIHPISSWYRVPYLGMYLPASAAAFKELAATISAISLDSDPDLREVEVFELQYRPLQPPHIPLAHQAEWQPHVFTPNPYDPLSPLRISGDKPKGTRFFDDVQPPRGWLWEGKKWSLDLEVGEWVAERLITGVEYGVGSINSGDGDASSSLEVGIEEFGGWVWDLPPKMVSPSDLEGEEMWLAYGDDINGGGGSRPKHHKKGKGSAEFKAVTRDWEEARWAGRTGEWRRRRWVRVVKRKGHRHDDKGMDLLTVPNEKARAMSVSYDSDSAYDTPTKN